MDRRRFLIAVTAASAALAAPHALFASTMPIARTRLVRGARQQLIGFPGGCAGTGRRTGALTMERMLTLRG